MKKSSRVLLYFIGSWLTVPTLSAQTFPILDTINPMPSYEERAKKWGPNDTAIRSAVWYNGEMMTYAMIDDAWVSNMSPKALQKYKEAYNRLRMAVYVTYPYARLAGATINEINRQMVGIISKPKRKSIIKSREKELRKQFTDPLTNLSVYQGKVLMKLINRQTGNNCFEILEEYKGWVNARGYQAVAFFFGGNLKQKWSMTDPTDRLIEDFVQEYESRYYYSPHMP